MILLARPIFNFQSFLLDFEKWAWTDGSTDTTCENSNYYRPWLWVGLVDQYFEKENDLEVQKHKN